MQSMKGLQVSIVCVCVCFEWVRGWLRGSTLALCPSYSEAQVYKRQFKSAREIVSVFEWVMNSCYTFACIALFANLWPLPPFQCILGFVLCGSRPKGDMRALQWGQGLPWLRKWQKNTLYSLWNQVFVSLYGCLKQACKHWIMFLLMGRRG